MQYEHECRLVLLFPSDASAVGLGDDFAALLGIEAGDEAHLLARLGAHNDLLQVDRVVAVLLRQGQRFGDCAADEFGGGGVAEDALGGAVQELDAAL